MPRRLRTLQPQLRFQPTETPRRKWSTASSRAAHEGLPGLVYVDNFINKEEETQLLAIIMSHPLLKVNTVNGRREGLNFGASWNGGTKFEPLPIWLKPFVERVEKA